jgi:uncharacterized protein
MRSQRSSTAALPVPASPTPAATPSTPVFRRLNRAACLLLLRRHVVGRMAYSFHDRVDITPIHYVYSNGWIFARTSHGAKMTTIAHSPWIAFEVDEVEGIFDWRSAVVHGTVYTSARDGGPVEARRWSRGIELLRQVVPETGTARDPVAFRDLVFGIHVDAITGRAAASGTGAGSPRSAAISS